jgi:hypothetical protein
LAIVWFGASRLHQNFLLGMAARIDDAQATITRQGPSSHGPSRRRPSRHGPSLNMIAWERPRVRCNSQCLTPHTPHPKWDRRSNGGEMGRDVRARLHWQTGELSLGCPSPSHTAQSTPVQGRKPFTSSWRRVRGLRVVGAAVGNVRALGEQLKEPVQSRSLPSEK